MSDPLAVALARLAPTVDLATSRELLDRSLDGGAGAKPPTNRRRLLAAACVLLLLAGTIGVWAVSRRSDDPGAPAAPTSAVPAARGDGTEFRVIAMEPVGEFDRPGLTTATSEDDLVRLLGDSRYGLEQLAGEVDFRHEIAVLVERPDNSCPPDIDRFAPVDDTWRLLWSASKEDDCEDIGVGWVYLVAIRRSALAGIDRVVLPGEAETSTSEVGATVRDAAIGPTLTAFAAGGIDGVYPAHDIAVFTEQPDWDRYAASELAASSDTALGLDRYVVAVFRLADDATCPGAFDRFDVEGGVWTAVFALAPGACEGGPLTTTYVVAVRRSALPDEVTFALAADGERGLDAAQLTVDVRGPDEPSTPFEVLASGDSAAEPGTIGVATSTALLRMLWDSFAIADDMPVVDFERYVVLTFAALDETCGAAFDGFDRGPGRPYPTWVVRFAAPQRGCPSPITSAFFVAVERAAIDGGVVFALPPTQRYAPDDARVAIDPAYSIPAVNWSCGPDDRQLFGITLDLPATSDLRIEVIDGGTVTGWGTLTNGGAAGTFGIEFGMTGPASPTSHAVITDVATGHEATRIPLAQLALPTCG